MAQSQNTLGGGAGKTGTAAPGRSDETTDIKACTGCGFKATTEFEGRDGELYPMCEVCDVHLREQEAEEGFEEETCADCRKEPATRRFMHLHKGEFFLCEGCFGMADHEDDYLEVCTCPNPTPARGAGAALECMECLRDIKTRRLCECPVVSRADEQRGTCDVCHGLVVKAKDE
jgi:hypothetical protein